MDKPSINNEDYLVHLKSLGYTIEPPKELVDNAEVFALASVIERVNKIENRINELEDRVTRLVSATLLLLIPALVLMLILFLYLLFN